jgi:hypothetical protein
MKKQLLILFCLLFAGYKSYGQELIKGGNMEDPSAWNVYWNTFDAKDTGIYQFNYTGDVPAAGQGGCYHVKAAGQAANMLWQKVTIIPGHKYELTGAYKYLADTAINVWVEFFITRIKPVGRNDSVSGEIATGLGYGMNTWNKADTVNLDGTFQDNFMLSPNTRTSTVFEIPDTVTQTEWYVAVKAGCWNSLGDTVPVYDLVIDELSMIDKSLVNAGGNMEDPGAWNVYWNTFDAKDTGTYEFNYTGNVPTAGQGGCYRVKAAGQAANMLWQPVTIIPGHQYKLEGAYKYIADTAINVWVEYFLTRIKPVGRNDSVSGEIATGIGYAMNTWNKADTVNLDGTFQDNFMLANTKTNKILIPDTVTQTEWYLAMKAGCWNSIGDTAPVYDLLFDEIHMYDIGAPKVSVLPIAKIVVGKVDSPADYTGKVTMSWDSDSLYMVYDVVDDSIVNMGASYQVDNIEVYLDMDNSKNVHWPRNGGWLKPVDDAYDTNDYQLRLVPDVDFATNNTAKPGIAISDTSVNQVYKRTADGYQFVLNIAWSGLMKGFEPAAGKLIGFDVLLSDNDKTASDANRNQITWNSPTANPFNDPSLFGVLKFIGTGSGYFESVPDVEKPTTPANLAVVVTGTGAKLTWDASTDNIVVQNYILYNGTKAVDTILAKQTGNSANFADLKVGDNTLGVVAADLYWNKSAKTTIKATIITGIDVNTISSIVVYPNPANDVINLKNVQSGTIINIYSVTGELVLSKVIDSDGSIDISLLKAGMYAIQLQNNDAITTIKLIKK